MLSPCTLSRVPRCPSQALRDTPPPPLLQARGRPVEADRDLRALLDIMRKDRARVRDMAYRLSGIIGEATAKLKILDPETGSRELLKLWGDEMVAAGLEVFQVP